MQKYTYSTSLMGYVNSIDAANKTFKMQCASGNVEIRTGSETDYRFLKNADMIDRDRVKTAEGFDFSKASIEDKINHYIKENILISVYGVYTRDGESEHFDARIINIAQSYDEMDGQYKNFLFEDGHWWITQIASFADNWLNNLFQNQVYNFANYRTNLGISGKSMPDENIQESATLSRLIYGLSSAYLLTGCHRYLDAAKEGVLYQRNWFRSLSNDGQTCFWAYGKKMVNDEIDLIMTSQNSDDYGTIPLYEQIYCLAGLAQYYRITLDWEVLNDIRTTVNSFKKFFYDENEKGFFSHLDYATLKTDSNALGDNKSKKNWNSIGDHLPAYLINLVLALDPLPKDCCSKEIEHFIGQCKEILDETSNLITEKFPNRDSSPFVNERFKANWDLDQAWRWQQNRAVCGHNLKIAWNLTRVTNSTYPTQDNIDKMSFVSNQIAERMSHIAIDQARGGIFDAVERQPDKDSFIEFVWGNTKDFWQQEQGILAYLILYGQTGNDNYLKLARETMFFWNLYFLDMNQGGIYFRTTDDGLPYMLGDYANKGGHALAGYHSLELSFLAHIYIRTYVSKEPFCLYFKPNSNCGMKSINVLPDFFQKGTLKMSRITINGIEKPIVNHNINCDYYYQIELSDKEIAEEAEIMVEFEPQK